MRKLTTRRERAEYIGCKLDLLYPDVQIPLRHSDAYTLLVATILSAQCTDTRVNEVTPRLFSRASTPEEMVQLSEEEVRDIVASCGLANNKSGNILRMSEQLIGGFAGKVPASYADLESLPGVGHKTAAVVLGQAFGVPAFPVDTHIHRLAQRWRLTNGKSPRQTEADLKKLFPEEEWNRRHIQMILYGREHCTARGCDGTVCEICRTCFPNRRAFKTKRG